MELIYQHGGVSQVAIGKMLEIGAGAQILIQVLSTGEILERLSIFGSVSIFRGS